MLESRSYYFPNENPEPTKGWAVSAKVSYGKEQYPGGLSNPWNYQECGCVGFNSRKDAETWLNRARKTGYLPQNAVVTIEKRGVI
jgi:hypothetical protein